MEKNNPEKKDLTKTEISSHFNFSKIDIYLVGLFLIQLYYFNLLTQSISVFAFRIVTAVSEFIPYISVIYGLMLFMFFVNFGKFYQSINKKDEEEKNEVLNSSLVSLFLIFFLNILAEVLITKIKF
jgi:hypothetical protein